MNATPSRAGQERVFAVGFLAAAPARVAEDVDVRRPEGQAEMFAAVAVVLGDVIIVLGAGFGGDDVRLLVNQRRVPGGRHADGLRKNRGDAGARHAVQTFVPIIVGRNAQPRNRRRVGHELRRLFRQRHPAHEVLHPRGQRLRRVLPDFRPGHDRHFQRRGIVATPGFITLSACA